MTRPGVVVRHRQGYRLRSPNQQVADRLLGSLLHGLGENRSRLRLELAGREEGDGGQVNTSPVRQATVPVRLRRDGPAASDFTWEVEMLLRAGRPQVAVALRDELSGETSFLVRRFDVGR